MTAGMQLLSVQKRPVVCTRFYYCNNVFRQPTGYIPPADGQPYLRNTM